jgi:hypothetical protein
MTHVPTALDQAMAIKHRVNGAFGGDFDVGESPDEALSDLAGAPAGVFTLHVQDKVLHLERKLVGIAIGTAASVRQSLNSAFLVAIEDLVAGLAGDSELPTEFGHWLAGDPQTEAFRPSPNTPSRASLPPPKGK